MPLRAYCPGGMYQKVTLLKTYQIYPQFVLVQNGFYTLSLFSYCPHLSGQCCKWNIANEILQMKHLQVLLSSRDLSCLWDMEKAGHCYSCFLSCCWETKQSTRATLSGNKKVDALFFSFVIWDSINHKTALKQWFSGLAETNTYVSSLSQIN